MSEEQLNKRIELAFLPTPLQGLNKLSKSNINVFMKRDDCTGLAGGGNKTRKLEFLLFDAKRKAEGKKLVVITAGGVQSNHCRQTAAACAQQSIECHLVLTKNVSDRDSVYFQTGNYQLNQLLGAKIHLHDKKDRAEAMIQLAEQLTKENENIFPYVIPLGGSSPVGCLGYVKCAKEMFVQIKEQKLPKIDAIYLATSSYGTQAGLVVGAALFGEEILGYLPHIIGVDVDGAPDAVPIEETVFSLCLSVCDLLSCSSVLRENVNVLCGYGGAGYGQPTDTSKEWIIKLAREEGILLDPVYSGKAFVGMMEQTKNRNVLFIHTGGLPGIFAYPDLCASECVSDESSP